MTPGGAAESVLSAGLVGLLDGQRLSDKIGLTIELHTVDESGWPRTALLSVGEVLALSPADLRLALWTGTTSAGNLARTGRATLSLIHEAIAYNVRVLATQAPDLHVRKMDLAVFDARVVEVRRDEVGYARMTSGITFVLPDEERVTARWRETIEALRVAPSRAG